jgi:hypothetical protein
MTTAYRVIRRSLALIGAIDPAEAVPPAAADDALEALNSLLSTWRLEGLLAYDIVRTLFALVPGQQDYPLGPGAQWNTTPVFDAQTPRPVRIDHMGLVDASQTPALEVPMQELSQEDYAYLTLKGLATSWPTHWQYSATIPLGTVFVWPAPTVAMQVAVYLPHALSSWLTVQTDKALPDGFDEALVTNLAVTLAPEYGTEASASVQYRALMSKALIMREQCPAYVMELDPRCPGIGGVSGRGINWFTGDPA